MENIIRSIDPTNLNRYGFFCYKSKPKTQGYHQKQEWLERCLPQGVRLKIINDGERSAGFIEYAPGEHTWRVVQAPGYMVIHCIWVVGSGQKKGYGARLLEQVTSEAKAIGMYGVVVVTSQSTWLAKKGFFLYNGFEVVGQAPPSFELLVKSFSPGTLPSFPDDWNTRLKRIPEGLVVYHSGQCPYHAMFVVSLMNAASQLGLPAQAVELTTCQDARTLSPTAYGVFGVVYNAQLLSYRPMGGNTLREMLGRQDG